MPKTTEQIMKEDNMYECNDNKLWYSEDEVNKIKNGLCNAIPKEEKVIRFIFNEYLLDELERS
jgi:hypothetical protein